MLGVDVVDVERLRTTLARSPGLESRLFSESERTYCADHTDPARHLAGTLAAKEAVIKALDLGTLVGWARRIEIERRPSGQPVATVDGKVVPISISHDGGVAVAVALATNP